MEKKNNKTIIALNPWERIVDVEKFKERHRGYVERNAGNRTYEPYAERLKQLEKLENDGTEI